MKPTPPKYALRFLRWFCRNDYIEEMEGDLIELFEFRAEDSLAKAKRGFIWDVFRSLRWRNIKKSGFYSTQTAMLSNYIKIGYRNIVKDLGFAMLNLLGLSMGIAVFMMMIMMVYHEFTFDHFHTKGKRIFEVIQEFQNVDGADPEIYTSLKLAEALREELPMVENAVTIHGAGSSWVEANGERFFEEDGIIAGKEFFEIFDYPLKYGQKDLALKNNRSIVLEEQLAKKLFGTDNPIGEIVDLERYGLFTVTGILETLPTNSFIQFNFILTQDYDVFFTKVAQWYPPWFESWEGDPATTFVLLHHQEDAKQFSAQLKPILEKHLGTENPINPHYLINMRDLHFQSKGIDGRVNEYIKGDINQVRILILVAILILAMACFNYINLTTARSMKRTKEVGIRKSIGALNQQISAQFLVESFLQVFLAFLLSIGWIYFLQAYFQTITGINLQVSWQNIGVLAPYMALALISLSLLAGFYPALFLSRFSPVKVLKNSMVSVKGNSALRNALITLQYGLVIAMLAALLIVNYQYSYMGDKNLGFDQDQLVIVEVSGAGVRNNFTTLKEELLKNPNVSDVTGLTRMISGYRSSVGIYGLDEENPNQKHPMRFYGMDEDGIETLGLNIKFGTNFQGIKSVDSSSVFLNETAARLYGGEQVVGKTIILTDEDDETEQYQVKVIGIIEDFHYRSLHDPIGPITIGYYQNPFEGLDDVVIKIADRNIPETLAFINATHNKFDENDVMTWEFMDEMVQRAYEKEIIFRDVFMGASAISLLIALLGIIGLLTYNMMAKTKEFGIRKVLGANYLQLLTIQGKGFVKFMLIGACIVIPLVWWFAHLWLQDYAFRIKLTPVPFIMSITLIFICTLLTLWVVNHQFIKKNPVEALRYE